MKDFIISGRVTANNEEEVRYNATLTGGHGILVFEEIEGDDYEEGTCIFCGCQLQDNDHENSCAKCE